MKLTKTASGKRILSMTESEWQKIGEKSGWIKMARDSAYDPNMTEGVSGDAGKPKCKNCGTPADRIVDAAVQEWACQKCKTVNRLKGAKSLVFPERLEETGKESPAEKKS